MKIIGISGQKGGVGKTTLAVNLAGFWARRGLRVSILDRDPQAAAAKWARADPGLPFPVHDEINAPLRSALSARKSIGENLVIVDTAPSVGGAFRELPSVADFVLLPARPSVLDFRALMESVEVLKGSTVKSAVVLTQVSERQTITKQALEALASLGVPVLQTRIHARAAFQSSALQNRTVFELGKAGEKAASDISALAEEIDDFLGLKKAKSAKQ